MKILIIDDEELYITGLKELLTHIDENCEINACCDYNNIKNNILSNQYDLIFITKTPKIDILTSEYISTDIVNYMRYNVAGYISKKYSNDKIFNIINLILLNETYFPNNLVINSFKKIITNKQIDVIKLINKGLSNKQIAYELNISESTVKVHITNILKRMKCYNRVQLLNKAKELGIDLT